MSKILHVVPTLNYGGISSVLRNWVKATSEDNDLRFDVLSFNDGPIRSVIESNGGNVYICKTIRKQPASYFYKIYKTLKKGEYDAVHVHNSFKNGILLLLARVMGVKVRVCHSHTSGLEDSTLTLFLPLLKYIAVSNSNRLVACGKEAGDFLYGKRPFRIINNAVDVDRFVNLEHNNVNCSDFGIPKNKVIVGHVGRFSDVKNHRFLLDIACQVDERFHFAFMGDGPLKVEIKRTIESLGLVNNVTIIDSSDKIPEFLSILDLFVLPSKFEGVSLALLEAQASSLLCLVSDRIPIENDIGMNKVKFLPISDPTIWSDEIFKYKSEAALEPEYVENAFFKNKLSLKYIKIELNELYK